MAGPTTVQVAARGVVLDGELEVPDGPLGVVLFAHGSGSGRHSPRNQFVAEQLRAKRLGTLLIDLLTAEEERIDLVTAELRFDIKMLAERLAGATEWILEQPATRELRIGYFGASTGAGAALIAAAERPDAVHAVVSRGGRPDLAGDALERVEAPTLLVVGGEDHVVIELNREAMERMHAAVQLEIVPGATHLFEEPGKLEDVARLAGDWFARYLAAERRWT